MSSSRSSGIVLKLSHFRAVCAINPAGRTSIEPSSGSIEKCIHSFTLVSGARRGKPLSDVCVCSDSNDWFGDFLTRPELGESMSLNIDLGSCVVQDGATIESLLGQIFLLVKKERASKQQKSCERCEALKEAHRKYKNLTQRKIEALEAQLQDAKLRLSQNSHIEVLAEDSILIETPKKKTEQIEEVPETQDSPRVLRSPASSVRCKLPETSKPRFKRENTWITTQSQTKRDKKIEELEPSKASECGECEKFFENMDPGYAREIKKCSKHRQRPNYPAVPADMWRTNLQDTPELKAQGLHEDTLPCDLKIRSLPRKKLL